MTWLHVHHTFAVHPAQQRADVMSTTSNRTKDWYIPHKTFTVSHGTCSLMTWLHVCNTFATHPVQQTRDPMLKTSSRMKGWHIPNKTFTVSNGTCLLMTRHNSCNQMKQTPIVWMLTDSTSQHSATVVRSKACGNVTMRGGARSTVQKLSMQLGKRINFR